MLSRIITRIMPMLFLFVSAAFATAPGWVAKGVVLDYSIDGDTVTFTVTSRTSTEIKMNIGSNKAIENASLIYGQFWFDNSLLEGASKGSKIDEFTVKDKGTQTFARTEWNTVTLEGTISGAKTTRVYDQETGLMLKQTVQATGAPVVTLTDYDIPDFGAAPPTPVQPTTQATEPSQPGTQTTSQPSQPEEIEEPEPQQVTTAVNASPKAPKAEEESGGCLSGAVLIFLAGLAFVKS